MSATVTRIGSKQKDCRPPPCEPHDFEYQHGTSTVIMPNGTAVSIKQSAASWATAEQAERFTELQLAMSLAWAEAWAAEQGSA